MKATKNMLNHLAEIGLSKYESKVYLTLISEGVSSAKDISDVTGIPYGKVYEIINSLSQKGFAVILPTKPMKYKATSPHKAFIAAKNNMQQRFDKLEQNLIEDLEPMFEKNKNFAQPRSSFSLITGRSNIVKKTEELIARAEQSINIQCSANSLSRLLLHRDALKEASERGISISISGTINKENKEELKSLDFCALKHISSSKSNLLSIDGKECLVTEPVPDDDNILYGRDIGIYAFSQSFSRFMDNFFTEGFGRANQAVLK